MSGRTNEQHLAGGDKGLRVGIAAHPTRIVGQQFLGEIEGPFLTKGTPESDGMAGIYERDQLAFEVRIITIRPSLRDTLLRNEIFVVHDHNWICDQPHRSE